MSVSGEHFRLVSASAFASMFGSGERFRLVDVSREEDAGWLQVEEESWRNRTALPREPAFSRCFLLLFSTAAELVRRFLGMITTKRAQSRNKALNRDVETMDNRCWSCQRVVE